MGRIEANVDILVKRGDDCDARLNTLEKGGAKIKGALAILSLLFTLGCAYIVAGCAHYHQKEYVNGQLTSSTVSTVIGTGETSLLFAPGVTEYTTLGTGVSDNATEIIEDAVTVTPPGAAAGVFGGLINAVVE